MSVRRKKRQAIVLPRLSPARRLLELGKDLLILLLICSAVYLAGRSRLYSTVENSGVLGTLTELLAGDPAGPLPTDAHDPHTIGPQPVRLALTLPSEEGVARYGLQYDPYQVHREFALFSGFLSEALASARSPRLVRPEQWREALSTPGLYVDLLGPTPISALRRWMGQQYIRPNMVEGTVRRLVLSVPEGADTAVLLYQNLDDDAYYSCTTTVAGAGYLLPALERYTDNGARFAFELDQDGFGDLAPEVLILPTAPRPGIYSVAAPLDLSDDGNRVRLERALQFYAADYPVGGDWVTRENGTLRLSPGGLLRYEAAADHSPERYHVGRDVTSVVEGTWTLVSDALAVWCAGQTDSFRLYLDTLERTGPESWKLTYQYALEGAQVVLPGGPAAQFVVEDGHVTAFQLRLRCYQPTGETTLLLGETQAAAALGALDHRRGLELTLCYEDNGTTAQAGWCAWR